MIISLRPTGLPSRPGLWQIGLIELLCLFPQSYPQSGKFLINPLGRCAA
ncbi:hypothetical protein D560_1758 [Bordetella holmesii ATCC 51541]|nr:hypothetical protein D560_1758 [Bordetella holmesii ATCC 51541]KAK77940.1 hypothetical protein L503_3422 [Bordetella holmesii CDC-H809-BH]